MSLNSKKRSLYVDPTKNTGFVIVKKKKTSCLKKQTTESSVEEEYLLLQEKLKKTQSQLEKITQEKVALEDKCRTLHTTNQTLQKNNMKLEGLNKACLNALFESCQTEEQITHLRGLLETDFNLGYEKQLKKNIIDFKSHLSKKEKNEVSRALEVIEKYE